MGNRVLSDLQMVEGCKSGENKPESKVSETYESEKKLKQGGIEAFSETSLPQLEKSKWLLENLETMYH